jgi:hypothetical protein
LEAQTSDTESGIQVLEQLKVLTSAVNSLQQRPDQSEASFDPSALAGDVHTIRSQLQQLSEANEALAFLRAKVESLESTLEEKNRLLEAVTESNRCRFLCNGRFQLKLTDKS